MSTLTISLHSFGYQKSGIPEDNSPHHGGFVFDCRALPNPGRQDEYRHLTGQDPETISYLQSHPVVAEFITACQSILQLAIKRYQEMGYERLMVSFGCTGGQHRSVYCAEQIRGFLDKKGINTVLTHHDMPVKENK